MSNVIKEKKVCEFTFWIWENKTFKKIQVMASSAEEAHDMLRFYMECRCIKGVIHNVETA